MGRPESATAGDGGGSAGSSVGRLASSCGVVVAFAVVPIVSAVLAWRHNYWWCDLADKTTASLPEQHPDPAALGEAHILYTATEDNFPGLLSSMVSVARHIEEPGRCTIHVMVAPEALGAAEELVACYRREVGSFREVADVQLHSVSEMPINTTDYVSPTEMQRFLNPMIYTRLFAHDYLPSSAKRVVYLDADTIVQADLTPLHRMRMQHVAALLEDGGGLGPYSECIKLNPDMLPLLQEIGAENIFNAGVIVIDLDRWRQEQVWREVFRWIPASRGCMGDQFALNMAVLGRYDRLPWPYNVAPLGNNAMSGNFLPKCMLDRAAVLHWAGGMKFWHRKRNRHYDRIVAPYAPHGRCAAELFRAQGVNALYGGEG